jgi:hypothetical protein
MFAFVVARSIQDGTFIGSKEEKSQCMSKAFECLQAFKSDLALFEVGNFSCFDDVLGIRQVQCGI